MRCGSATSLSAGEEILKSGALLGIYPEGTRSPDGRLYRGKTGVAKLILATGVPVIPVAMIGTDKVQPIGRRIPNIRRVGIIVGGRLQAIGPVDTIGGADARIPLVRWNEGGRAHEERTAEPGRFVAALVARLGAEPAGIEIVRPSLEDVYLEMVGYDAEPAPDASTDAATTAAAPTGKAPRS